MSTDIEGIEYSSQFGLKISGAIKINLKALSLITLYKLFNCAEILNKILAKNKNLSVLIYHMNHNFRMKITQFF